MRRLRWFADSGVWELDAETPMTMEGTARAVPGDALPLGISRGGRLSRPKQLDFFHRFMASPLVPSFAGDTSNGGQGLLLHHSHIFHLRQNWSTTVLEQFDIQKLISSLKETASNHLENSTLPKTIAKYIIEFLSLGFGTELLFTPQSSLLFEMYNLKKGNRGKAVFQHKFPQHNLMLEAVYPGLFMEKNGTYWDVPLSMAIDLNSAASSNVNYHLCLQHNSGQPKPFGHNHTREVPMSLLPGLCTKAAISFKKHVEFWRQKEGILKLVQPYDVFLSNPQICGVGIIGAVVSASMGENSTRFSARESCNSFDLCFHKNKFALFCDLFATISFKAQYGNFQRLFLDLTKFDAHLDFPSGSKFLSGAASLVRKYYFSEKPDAAAIHAVCPNLRVSLQQQIVGPLSFRFDTRILLESEDSSYSARLNDSVFAIDWALKVLGSAKASLWYSPKYQEGMVELRFFENFF